MKQVKKKKEIIKTICDSVNHTRFPKEDHLPDWARWDNKVTKGDRAEYLYIVVFICCLLKGKDSSSSCIHSFTSV